jgi:hypothetical protein
MQDNSKILRFHWVHFLGFLLFIWTSFYIHSDGERYDTNFGTILYLPYVFLLTVYNLIIITISNGILDINGLIEKYNLKLISYVIPIVPVLIWYLIASFSITLGEWVINDYYFWSLILVWGIMNFGLYLMINKKTARP